jgi:spore coat protein A
MFKEYSYPNAHRAATLWYHDHRLDFTGPQVYRGLAGMYVLRDGVDDGLPLPKDEKDVPLVITDRTFRDDGSFYYPSLDPTLQDEPGVLAHAANGMFGDTVLVNGAPWPQLEVSNTMHRLRILNASNARSYDLALDPPPPGGSRSSRSAATAACWKRPSPTTASSPRPPSASTWWWTSRATRWARR